MKELDDLNLPDDLGYTDDHEWALLIKEETVKIGVTDYAQDQLGDIVFVELPSVGDTFEKGDEFGTLESVKAVSELYIPMSGKVIAVNEDLEDSPELINEDPYFNWIVEIEPEDTDEFQQLLDAAAYLNLLKG